MKCFLSHSSRDKAAYASIVARALQPNVEYDEVTFEEGMGNLEEILKALDRSDLFVLLISENSLDSEWVGKEITEAEHRLSIGQLKRIFPIIIDRTINHTDHRIPEWIRETYNLRPITRPTIAAKRIRERMLELSWQSHPMLKERNQIFVGRNNQIFEFEQRLDDFTKQHPVVVFASGLNEIGRKSTIKYALRKSNIIRDTYDPIRIDLDRDDGVEGFILKLHDIGMSNNENVENLLSRQIEEKVSLCARLLNDVADHKEIIIVNDNYCIVRYGGEVAPWFTELVKQIKDNKVTVCAATSARPMRNPFIRDERYFFIHVSELERSERIGLFRRYSDLLNLELRAVDYENFTPLLKGLPEQVTYAASLIAELGPDRAFKQSYDIASFSTYRANIIIRRFEGDVELIEFLRFISSFEFVSIDFLSKISDLIDKKIIHHVDRLLMENVCEVIGPTGNYFRVNEVVRDAIIRDRGAISDDYAKALRSFAEEFTKSYDSDTYDVTEYQLAIKEALSSGISVPGRLLIPAHFLQTMRQLYDSRSYREVIRLADRVLENSGTFDGHTEQDIRYYLCQSLARLSDSRFLAEVQHIIGPEHDFLLGFYYRIKRRFKDALARYQKAKQHQRTEQRARREIVFVLITIEDFENALSLARENFERYKQNPYLAQSYFYCLLHDPDRDNAKIQTEIVLEALKSIGGSRASEMYENLKALHDFDFGDRSEAFDRINAAIDRHPDIIYPLLTKLDMAIGAEDATLLTETISKLKERNSSSNQKSAIAKGDAILAAIKGDYERAMRLLTGDLAELSDPAKERLERKIRRLVGKGL